MLSEYRPPEGTQGFFRALSEADGFVAEVERAQELACRCDELSGLVDQIKELHRPGAWLNCINACCSGEDCQLRSRYCVDCDQEWPCPTMKMIENG